MKKNKGTSIKYKNEDIGEIKTLFLITGIIVLIAVGLYFITNLVAERKNKAEELPEPEISYVDVVLGEMFDKPMDEYYVFAFSVLDSKANKFFNLMSNYEKTDDPTWVYFADLNLIFNRFASSEESNPKPTHPTEIRINEVALFHIKGGKVHKFYEDITEIEKVLS